MNSNFVRAIRDDGIWHFNFEQANCQVADEYIAYMTELVNQVVPGEIKTEFPIRILWETQDMVVSVFNYIMFHSKRIPHISDLKYRIAYLNKSYNRSILMEQMLGTRMKLFQSQRAFFLHPQYDEAIMWLLQDR